MDKNLLFLFIESPSDRAPYVIHLVQDSSRVWTPVGLHGHPVGLVGATAGHPRSGATEVLQLLPGLQVWVATSMKKKAKKKHSEISFSIFYLHVLVPNSL